jgi:hypothetical protein
MVIPINKNQNERVPPREQTMNKSREQTMNKPREQTKNKPREQTMNKPKRTNPEL